MCERRRMPLGQWRDTYTPFLQPESLPFFRRIVREPSGLVGCWHAQRTGRFTPLTSNSARIFICCPSMPFGRMMETWRNWPAYGWPASRFPPALARPIHTLCVDAEHSRHSGHPVVDDTQNQFHRVVAFSLPNKGWAHTIAKPSLHGLKRIRILNVI